MPLGDRDAESPDCDVSHPSSDLYSYYYSTTRPRTRRARGPRPPRRRCREKSQRDPTCIIWCDCVHRQRYVSASPQVRRLCQCPATLWNYGIIVCLIVLISRSITQYNSCRACDGQASNSMERLTATERVSHVRISSRRAAYVPPATDLSPASLVTPEATPVSLHLKLPPYYMGVMPVAGYTWHLIM